MPYLEREELKELTDEIAKLKMELAAKEAQILELRLVIGAIQQTVNDADWYDYLRKALATKPSTEYLKSWLGEPVLFRSHSGSIGFTVKDFSPSQRTQPITKLYAPKGLEK